MLYILSSVRKSPRDIFCGWFFFGARKDVSMYEVHGVEVEVQGGMKLLGPRLEDITDDDEEKVLTHDCDW